MSTIIHSNGSKSLGNPPDSIDILFQVLDEYPLDREIEYRGGFIKKDKNSTHFSGNFLTVAHVFNIDTDDPKIIKQLTAAILKNKQRPDYLSQDDYANKQAEYKKRHAKEVAERQKTKTTTP